MANKGWTSPSRRLEPGGPTSTVRLSKTSDPTGEPSAKVCDWACAPETVGSQFRNGGWKKFDLPTCNDYVNTAGAMNKQPPGYAGGDADSGDKYVPAAYPGGTVA